jgi:hypothetical protein
MRSVFLAALWLLICVILIYGPDCGLGFIKDDYAWIANSQLDGWNAVTRTFANAPMGFYRPMVSLSFGINYLVSGLDARPYGLTNLALAIATAVAIGALVVRLGLSAGVALFAAAVWILNFHGISMAVLWTSGRTSLLGTFLAVCAACALTASRSISSGVLMLAALLSKEEPLALPVVFGLWRLIDARQGTQSPRSGPVRTSAPVWATFIAAAIYMAIRSTTGAITPSTAPDFYQYRASALAPNTLHYLDRSLTLTSSLLLLGALFVSRQRFRLTPLERSIVLKGLVWLVLGFALTLMIPVRSSLYVCLPSVGSSLIVAGIGAAEWRAIDRQRVVMICLLALPIALLPVYWARSLELRSEEVLATNVMTVLSERLAARPVRRLVVYDDPAHHPSVADAFGEALPIALRLFAPHNVPADIAILPRDTATSEPAAPDTLELVLVGNTLKDRTAH